MTSQSTHPRAPTVAVVTCRDMPEPDEDEAVLLAALSEAELQPVLVSWDDTSVDWSRFTVSVIRSTWNYPQFPREFLRWIDETARVTRLCNPASVLKSNVHKGYLLTLHDAGIPVVPTALVPQGSAQALDSLLAERGWTECVVKPAISGGSWRTIRIDQDSLDVGQRHLDALTLDGDVLVQPYLHGVEARGERSLVHIDGAFSHAVRKSPRFDGGEESVRLCDVSESELEVARRVLATIDEPLLYARVDVAPGPELSPVLMELELLEPSLFFVQQPRALTRFVDAIGQRCASVMHRGGG